MKIVQLATEFAPLAKVGGLGEVLLGLSRELTRIGEQVEVILPKYDFIDLKKISHLKLEVPDFKCLESGNLHANAMWSGLAEDCHIHLLEARHPAGYFHRGKIYGSDDDVARFLYFSRACVEYLKLKNEPIDILHLHDWHVSGAALLVKDLFHLPIKSIVLTIHNAEYQGQCAPWNLDAIGLKGSDYLVKEKLQDDQPNQPNQSGTINLLKGGIVYSDAIVAVSPTYAKEIVSTDTGHHIDKTFRKYQSKLSGILNGIDQKIWDPKNDPILPKPYSPESSIKVILEAKQAAREAIQKRFNLAKNSRPWIGSITRLVPQKGPALIEEGIRQTLELGGTFLLLGSSPAPKIQEHFEMVKKNYEGNNRVLFHFTYDESLSHLLYGALDFILVPSVYEPCGLTQLIAMRYGTIPIVRSTGGLKDTVFDCEDSKIPIQQRNGFTFQQAKPADLTAALQRAIHHFRSDPATFQAMIQRNLRIDCSWKKPAQDYLRLYKSLTIKHAVTPSRALF